MATGIEAYGYPQPPAQAPQGTIWGGGSAGGGQYPTGGGSFGVGVNPNPPHTQQQQAPWGGGMPIGSPGWQAVTGAAGQADQSFQQGLGRLAPGQYTGGQFGSFLQNQFGGGLGMDPRALEQQRRMAAEMEAGSRENALLRMGQQAAASGFGNSMGLVDAQARLRSGSAANLQNTYDQLFIQQELMKQQQKQAAAQMYAQLMGLEAGQQGQAAQMLAGRQFPAIPGMQYPGQQGGGQTGAQPVQMPGWSQSGQYMPGGTGYDPFYSGGGVGAGQGTGYSAQNPWKPF